MDHRIARLYLQEKRSWINEHCPDDLSREGQLMLAAAVPAVHIFDWSLIEQSEHLTCNLLYQTVWNFAIQMTVRRLIAWNPDALVREFRHRVRRKDPWDACWYEAARPLSAELDCRLIWAWVMQRHVIETWRGLLMDEDVARLQLRAYLDKTHSETPPKYLDCVTEVLMVRDARNEPAPVHLTYRLKTDDEASSDWPGVIIRWR